MPWQATSSDEELEEDPSISYEEVTGADLGTDFSFPQPHADCNGSMAMGSGLQQELRPTGSA